MNNFNEITERLIGEVQKIIETPKSEFKHTYTVIESDIFKYKGIEFTINVEIERNYENILDIYGIINNEKFYEIKNYLYYTRFDPKMRIQKKINEFDIYNSIKKIYIDTLQLIDDITFDMNHAYTIKLNQTNEKYNTDINYLSKIKMMIEEIKCLNTNK